MEAPIQAIFSIYVQDLVLYCLEFIGFFLFGIKRFYELYVHEAFCDMGLSAAHQSVLFEYY